MRTLDAGMATHVASEVTTLATCWKVTTTASVITGYTDHDKDLVISGVTYEAATGYSPTDIHNSDRLNVDNLDIIGMIQSAGITAEDIEAGTYDGATVEVFAVNWADLTDGTIILVKGVVGSITRRDDRYIAEMRSLAQYLAQNIIESTSTQCRADLGDARCKIRLDPPEWAATTAYTVRDAAEGGSGSVVKPSSDNGRHFKCTTAGTSGGSEPSWNTTIGGTTSDGTVTWTTIQALTRTDTVDTVTDAANFAGTNLDEADDYWTLGTLTWTGGDNIGRVMEVKDWTLTGKAIELYLPMPSAIQSGDTFTITAGCGKTPTTDCTTKFDNLNNFRGEPFIPGIDAYITHDST